MSLAIKLKKCFFLPSPIPAACKTVGSKSEPCIFPFKYGGQTFNRCTSTDAQPGSVWCATEVDDKGEVIDGRWGNCDTGCPGASELESSIYGVLSCVQKKAKKIWPLLLLSDPRHLEMRDSPSNSDDDEATERKIFLCPFQRMGRGEKRV